jgi:hypothetical protein
VLDLTLDKDVRLQPLGIWRKCVGKTLGVLEVFHKHIILVLSCADSHSRESSDMREWYSIEVVQRLHVLGIKDSESYREGEGAIPLPALLIRKVVKCSQGGQGSVYVY